MANTNRQSFRIVLLGNTGVGKTSIVRMFTEEAFTPSYPSTIGVCASYKRLTYKGRSAHFEVCDTGGQERYASLAPIYCRNAEAVLLCYDLTNIRSFEDIDRWHLTNGIPENAVIVVVGCKSDLVNQREVTEDMISEKTHGYKNIQFFKTSAKNNEKITEIFMHLLTVLMPEKVEEKSSKTSSSSEVITLEQKPDIKDKPEESESSSCCGWSS